MKHLSYFLILFIIGCSTTGTKRTLSAGSIGCLENEIEISHEERASWLATCKGKEFVCSASGQDTIKCTERLK
jgi:hypothetical protein